jgi:hypothetical protein
VGAVTESAPALLLLIVAVAPATGLRVKRTVCESEVAEVEAALGFRVWPVPRAGAADFAPLD